LLDDANAKGTLCLDVWCSLATAILREFERAERVEPLSAEVWAHDDFGTERSRNFIGRAGPLARIADHLNGGGQGIFGVLGQASSGKSALMAKAAEETRATHPDANVFVRFIGATPTSAEGRSLLDSLCREISRAYGAETSDIPSDYNELAVELGKRLELASADKPLILFLDALDQLTGAGRSLSWLPGTLPENVHVVVSTLPGGTERALRTKHPSPEIYQLDAMSHREGQALLRSWLSEAKRTLQDAQRDEVLGKFAAQGLPLYLRLAFEEARLWRSFAPAGETQLADGIPALIRENLFKRLALPANHGRVMVAHSLGYLAASRHGLSEEEMIDVLSRDDEVKEDFRAHAPNSPETDQLPVVVWSRLYFDLQPYLTERCAENTTLLASTTTSCETPPARPTSSNHIRNGATPSSPTTCAIAPTPSTTAPGRAPTLAASASSPSTSPMPATRGSTSCTRR
jgi:NACHT domain- and WD repeat-containing protein